MYEVSRGSVYNWLDADGISRSERRLKGQPARPEGAELRRLYEEEGLKLEVLGKRFRRRGMPSRRAHVGWDRHHVHHEDQRLAQQASPVLSDPRHSIWGQHNGVAWDGQSIAGKLHSGAQDTRSDSTARRG
jgi:hypothetical protein